MRLLVGIRWGPSIVLHAELGHCLLRIWISVPVPWSCNVRWWIDAGFAMRCGKRRMRFTDVHNGFDVSVKRDGTALHVVDRHRDCLVEDALSEKAVPEVISGWGVWGERPRSPHARRGYRCCRNGAAPEARQSEAHAEPGELTLKRRVRLRAGQ